jgi:hypothetical protein
VWRQPDAEFAAKATAQPDLYQRAAADRGAFWADQARELLDWDTPFTEVLDWSHAPVARWFADGRLNACVNAVDRHAAAGRGGGHRDARLRAHRRPALGRLRQLGLGSAIEPEE